MQGGKNQKSDSTDRKTYVFLSPRSRNRTPAKHLGRKIKKIEGHMTFYLESKYQDSRSEEENQKMGCHTTPHLEGNLQIKPANTG